MTKAYLVKGWHMLDNGPPRARTIEWIACSCSSEQIAIARIEKILEAGCTYVDEHISTRVGTDNSGMRFFSIARSMPSTRDGSRCEIFESDDFPFGDHMRKHEHGDPNFPKKLKLDSAFYYKIEEVDHHTK